MEELVTGFARAASAWACFNTPPIQLSAVSLGPSIAIASIKKIAFLPDGLMTLHPRTVVVEQKPRYKGDSVIMDTSNVPEDVFEQHALVSQFTTESNRMSISACPALATS